jgi:hypothetical protein
MNKKLKTKTLGTKDEPLITILKGRHTKKVFDQAVKNEGWVTDPWDMDLFSYQWLRKTKNGFSKSDVNDLKAELYTVGEW